MTPPPTRPASPRAHGPDRDCPTCTPCSSCDGGRRVTPDVYRPVGAGPLRFALCIRCDGRTTTCLNLTRIPERIPAP